jgi:GntR family transcriptional regulator
MKQLDNDASPVYRQLTDRLMEEIEDGKLKPGDKLPSERELAERFGVSRMTARQTLSILERQGVVERRVGSGTFVSTRNIEMNLITFNSFTNSMLNKGLTPSTKVLSKRILTKPKVASKLKVPEDEPLFFTKRLRLADGIPVSLEESYTPYRYCNGIEDEIGDNESLYQILKSNYGILLVKAEQFMRTIVPDEMESKLLKISSSTPCFLFEEIACDDKGRETEFSKVLTRGDIVKYYVPSHEKKE